MLKQIVCTSFSAPVQCITSSAKRFDVLLPPNSLRVAVCAAGVNFADHLQTKNLYQERLTPPFVVGFEGYGRVVDSTSPRIRRHEYVCFSHVGAFSSLVDVPESRAFSLGSGGAAKDPLEAAALTVTYGTAHLALFHRAKVQAGDWVLVTAAAGGLGSAAMQLAKQAGCKVVAAAGGPAKLATIEGADALVDYTALKTVREVKDALLMATNGHGVDVGLDMVGGDVFFEGVQRAMAFEGRLVSLGFASGTIPKAKPNLALVGNYDMCGVYWGAYFKQGPQALRHSMTQVLQLYGQGKIRPKVAKVFKPEAAAEAIAAVASRDTAGKVVIDFGVPA